MEAPERMVQIEEEIVSGLVASARDDFHEGGPLFRQESERTEPALRMIERPRPAEAPKFFREHEPLHRVAMRPPTVPELADIAAGVVAIRGQSGPAQKTGDAEKERFDCVHLIPQRSYREPLGEKRERELVFFVAEGRGDFLEERGVAPMSFHNVFETSSFSLKPE